MRPPPREEGRIITGHRLVDNVNSLTHFTHFTTISEKFLPSFRVFFVINRKILHFYCLTQICIARTCCRPVSVCLSHASIVSKRQNLSYIFFWPSGSPIIQALWPRMPIPNSKGNPVSGGTKYTGWRKFSIFDWNCRLSRKRCEIGRWLLWNVNRSWVPGRMISFSMTLSDPKPGVQGHGIPTSRIYQVSNAS